MEKTTCSKCSGDLGDRAGKQRYCRKCHAAYMRATRPRYRDLTPEQRYRGNSRSIAKNALKAGKITRQACEVCRRPAEMHHDDYDNPLDVRWLCPIHHRLHHRQNPAPHKPRPRKPKAKVDSPGTLLHTPCPMKINLYDETCRLLKGRPKGVSLRVIAEESGLNYEWLKKILYEGIPDPGVKKMQALHDFLADKQWEEVA